jgi:hypothetical protein
LHIAAQLANATITRVWRHYPTVRALRGNLAAKRFTLFFLGRSEICKTAHETEYRNSEECFDHVRTSVVGVRSSDVPPTSAIVRRQCSSVAIPAAVSGTRRVPSANHLKIASPLGAKLEQAVPRMVGLP